jgi:glycosyltransferase involved in cell wall biosynthesis
MTHPRVLIVSPVKFNQETGSGVTMGNLFKGWPIDKIAQVHSDNYTTADTSICTQYYYLPYYRVRDSNPIGTTLEFTRQAVQYLLCKQVSLVGQWLHTRDLIDWCAEFQPEIIYCRPHPRPSFYIWLPLELSKTFSVPFVTRILDDWPAKIEHEATFARRIYWRLVLRRKFQTLVDLSETNIGISEEMCTAFNQRYNNQFISFHNCIEIDKWIDLENDYQIADSFKIVYLGTVTKEKELSSLIDFKKAVLSLIEQGYPIQWTIYGPQIYQKTIEQFLTRPPEITYGGYFPIEMKQKILTEADLLLLPINFDAASQVYVGYSFQTKLPEYMASGTPILVYGPPGNPNVEYAKKGQWAAVVDENNPKKLISIFVKLIEDIEFRKQLGQEARKLAIRNHNAEIIRPIFQKMIVKSSRLE